MKLPKLEIPMLRNILDLSRKHAATDPVLRSALDEYDANEEYRRVFRDEQLRTRGVACLECGTVFIPRKGERLFCSLGCRLM